MENLRNDDLNTKNENTHTREITDLLTQKQITLNEKDVKIEKGVSISQLEAEYIINYIESNKKTIEKIVLRGEHFTQLPDDINVKELILDKTSITKIPESTKCRGGTIMIIGRKENPVNITENVIQLGKTSFVCHFENCILPNSIRDLQEDPMLDDLKIINCIGTDGEEIVNSGEDYDDLNKHYIL